MSSVRPKFSIQFTRLLVTVIQVVLLAGCGSPKHKDEIRVSEVTLFGDMACYRIETASATYVYGKRGAGFASILDLEGNDWISYRHGGKALGEYRGLPKCGQPVKYFHCGYGFGAYANDNPFETTVTEQSSSHVRLHSVTSDGAAECVWDFYPNHATMTLMRIPGRYWFLYEGTPGGTLDIEEDFVIRSDQQKLPLSTPWIGDFSWMLFSAKESNAGLLCAVHQPSTPVSYVSWPYKPDANGGLNQMTVSGFGRPDWQSPDQHKPQLEGLPARFSIALVPQATADVIREFLPLLEVK